MISFQVNDMTCGHCVRAITQAVHAVDAGARVEVDLAGHQVHIGAGSAGAEALRQAIAEAGYTPLPVVAAAAPAQPRAAGGCGGGGCCCGS